MSFNWINANEISFNSFLLMDRWIIRMIVKILRAGMSSEVTLELHWLIIQLSHGTSLIKVQKVNLTLIH